MTALYFYHKFEEICNATLYLLLQELIEPRSGLQESLLLCILCLLVRQVATNRETVVHATEKVDLEWLRDLVAREDLLGFVALFGREDVVELGGCDGDGSFDGGEFFGGDEGGVGEEADVDTILHLADNVLRGVSILNRVV